MSCCMPWVYCMEWNYKYTKCSVQCGVAKSLMIPEIQYNADDWVVRGRGELAVFVIRFSQFVVNEVKGVERPVTIDTSRMSCDC